MNDPVVLLVEDDPAHAELARRALETVAADPAIKIASPVDAEPVQVTRLAQVLTKDLGVPAAEIPTSPAAS